GDQTALHSFPTRRSSDLEIITQLMIKQETTSDIKISNACSGTNLLIKIQIAAKQLDTIIARVGTELLFNFNRNLGALPCSAKPKDRKSTRLNSSHVKISY